MEEDVDEIKKEKRENLTFGTYSFKYILSGVY
jgi:hypothetical protein